jgi:vancomycin permeability regulator SanA
LEISRHDPDIEKRILNRTLPYDVGYAGTTLYPIWRVAELFSVKMFLIRDERFNNKIALFTIPTDQIENLFTVTVRVGEISITESGDKDIRIELPINVSVELHPEAKYVSAASIMAS